MSKSIRLTTVHNSFITGIKIWSASRQVKRFFNPATFAVLPEDKESFQFINAGKALLHAAVLTYVLDNVPEHGALTKQEIVANMSGSVPVAYNIEVTVTFQDGHTASWNTSITATEVKTS